MISAITFQTAQAQTCINEKNIELEFKKPSITIIEVPKPSKLVKNPETAAYGSRVGAFTRFQGIDLKANGNSCNEPLKINVTWKKPIYIFMPKKTEIGACNYDPLLKHEMVHANIFLNTPENMTNFIKSSILQNGASPQNLNKITAQIVQEMRKRNNDFHKIESQKTIDPRCHPGLSISNGQLKNTPFNQWRW